jgi:hypothetical protein
VTWDADFSPIRDKELVRKETGQNFVTRDEFEQVKGEKYMRGICMQLWDDPQINWDGKILGCGRNFWGEFGGNAFTDGLADSLNGEKITYARDMLTGKKPEREDIPCASCEMYHGMRDRSRYLVRR